MEMKLPQNLGRAEAIDLMVPWTSIIKPDQEITPFIKMARIGRKKLTRTGRKKKVADQANLSL